MRLHGNKISALKSEETLLEAEAAPKLIGNFLGVFSRRVSSHFLELFREMRLVVIVFVQIVLEQVEGTSLRPLPIKPLKPKDSGQDLRRKAHVLLEEQIQIAPGITGSLF